jgi:hypothetical protein
MAVVETARPAPTPDALASLTSSLPHSLTHRSLSQDGRCASPPIVFAASLPPLHCSLSGAPTAAGRYTAGLPINESNRAMNDWLRRVRGTKTTKTTKLTGILGPTARRPDVVTIVRRTLNYIHMTYTTLHDIPYITLHWPMVTTLHYIQAYIQDMTLCFSLWYVMWCHVMSCDVM